jgi:hypothetical protein
LCWTFSGLLNAAQNSTAGFSASPRHHSAKMRFASFRPVYLSKELTEYRNITVFAGKVFALLASGCEEQLFHAIFAFLLASTS